MEKRYIAHKKSFIKLSTALLFVSSVFLMSCKQVLLPQPGGFDQSKNSSGSITTEWTAPTDLKVTQGLQGRIELTWKPVLNAVRYFMYRSDTPFGNFVQVGETTDALYTQKVTAGTDTYYKITAINLQNQETDYSIAVRGTSLAQPVISDIQGDAQEGDSTVTVYWYMNNVDAYADAVRYELVCYDATGKEQKRIPGESGNKTELTVTGLTPNTTYLYQVEAYNIAEQDKTEASDKIDAQTARRLRPNPPENLTVSQGAFGDKVEVSFVLPTKVDVAVEKNVYKQFPLYFKIYRKVAGEDDSTYEPVCGYFGSIKDIADKNNGVCFADQADVKDSTQGDGTITENNPEDAPYQEGETVTWTDNNVVRGRQYQYKVQSYTDIVPRVITSDKSIATSEPAWAVAPLSYLMNQVDYVNEVGENNTPLFHKTAKLSAQLKFDTMGKASDYSYDLTIYCRDYDKASGKWKEEEIEDEKNFASVEDLNAYIYETKELTSTLQSYTFSVDVKHVSGAWNEIVTTTNSRYVVKDLQPLVVQNLVVEDGYPGKFVLTWDRDPTVTYEIKYKDVLAEPDAGFNSVETIPADAEAQPGHVTSYQYELKHYGENKPVKSGDAIYIQIVPSAEGDSSAIPEKPDSAFYTLGTPAVTFEESKTAADSITVTWPKIEKATSYEVTYAYDDVPVETQILRDGVATTFADAYKTDTQIIPVTKEEEIHTCVIPKPIGYDYMAYSGKDVAVTVKAINETRKTETAKTITTRTLGPAATGINATVATKENIIDVSWKKVPGATGYLIARTRYGATNTDDSRSTDGEFVYFYDASKLSVVGQDITLNPSIKVTSDGDTFTLADTYTGSTGVAMDDPTRKFRIEQDKLGWGYPYRYQVFPVKESSPSFVRTDDNLNQCTVGSVTYQDADRNYATGSAIGYGLDVKATKAESANTVTVTWTKPYLTGTNLTPKIYRSELNSASWTDCSSLYDGKLNSQSTNIELKASYEGANKTVPYKYIVTYSDSSLPNSTYQNLLESTKENGESINIGYYFAIENISVSKNKEVEEITIPRYNLQERKQGPDGYRLYLTNVDHNEGKEVLIGEFDKKLSEFTPDASLNGSIASSYTPDLISHKPTLKLTPIFDSATERHSGILNIDKGYKHSYRLEAYRSTENSETPVTTNVTDWGTRKLTYSEFLYLACKAINEGVEVVGNSATTGAWTYQSAKWYPHMNDTVLGTSSKWADWWGFVFKDFKSENSVFAIRGRLGANTNGNWKRPKMYFTNMTGEGKPAWLNNDHSNYSCGTALKITGPAELNGLFDGYISFIDVGKTGGGSIVVQFGENPSDSKTYTDGFVKWTTLVHD